MMPSIGADLRGLYQRASQLHIPKMPKAIILESPKSAISPDALPSSIKRVHMDS